MRPIRALLATAATFAASVPSPAAMQTRSLWHSPVPYLFGGLAAMLGLIAFALLILACSYWRLSGRLDSGEDRDLENGNEKDGSKLEGKVYEEKILVIMAGDKKPTFLATPVSGRVSVLNTKIENRGGDEKTEHEEEEKNKEEVQNDDETS